VSFVKAEKNLSLHDTAISKSKDNPSLILGDFRSFHVFLLVFIDGVAKKRSNRCVAAIASLLRRTKERLMARPAFGAFFESIFLGAEFCWMRVSGLLVDNVCRQQVEQCIDF
jgi:hypothetical protein